MRISWEGTLSECSVSHPSLENGSGLEGITQGDLFPLEMGGERYTSWSKGEKQAGAASGDKSKIQGCFGNGPSCQNSTVSPQAALPEYRWIWGVLKKKKKSQPRGPS